jgi:hypothetical protein
MRVRPLLLTFLVTAGLAPGAWARSGRQLTLTQSNLGVCEIIADDDRLLGQTVTVRAPYSTDYMHYAGLQGPECRRSLMIDVEGRAALGADRLRGLLNEIERTERQLHVTVTGRLKRCDLSALCVAIVPDSYSEFEVVERP